MTDLEQRVAALNERLDRAHKEALRLTNGRDRSFRMTVPPDPNRDSDLLLLDGIDAGREAVAAIADSGEVAGLRGTVPDALVVDDACGAMGLCELRKGHEGKHTTSVDRALEGVVLRAAPPSSVDGEGLRAAVQTLVDDNPCRCDEAWTGRGRHAPDCVADLLYAYGIPAALAATSSGSEGGE